MISEAPRANGIQEHRAEATKRYAAKNTASAAETPAAFGGLKKEGNQ
jgi:hypothetical protein